MVILSGPAFAFAQAPPGPDAASTVAAIEQAVVDAIARAERSIVTIARAPASPVESALRVESPFAELREPSAAEPVTVAAGVIIDPAGFVLTHYLAVREGDEHTITTLDGKRHRATIRAADPRSALAVLAIETTTGPLQGADKNAGTFPAIRFGDAAKLRKGQFVVAIGNPFAIETDGQATASWGIVTNLARKAPADTNLNDAPGPMQDYRTTLHHLGTLIQTDAKLGWSAGGGALVNMQGELLGITTTAAAIAGHEQPAGYAIPIDATFRRIIDTLKEGREVEYGMLGVTFREPASDAATTMDPNVSVQQVFAGSPAARAGLLAKDVVTKVAGQPVRSVDDMQLAVSTRPPESSITLTYERDGRRGEARAKLAKLAVAGKKIVTVRPESWQGIHVDYATALDAVQLTEAISSNSFDPDGCVLVSDVERDSAAWQAGVRPGMFISHVGGKRVSTPNEFRRAVQAVGDVRDIKLTRPIAKQADDDATDSETPIRER
jgi:S1-C subfamily serine protease